MGLGAVGTGGFPGALGVGFAATTGGLGFAATGGGPLDAKELDGRELAGESSGVELLVGVFFHGVAEPFAAAMPGKTATGFAFAFAVRDATETFAWEDVTGVCFTPGAGGGALDLGGGGGAGAAAFGGTSSM